MTTNERQQVSLVLGSGGARGLAHIGIIRELESRDFHIASYPPDVIIDISRNACGTFDFDRAAEIIQLGKQKARRALSLH